MKERWVKINILGFPLKVILSFPKIKLDKTPALLPKTTDPLAAPL